MKKMRTISGTIQIEGGHEAFQDAILVVRILEVSRIDAPATEVASTIISGIAYDPAAPSPIDFTLTCKNVDERAHYIVWALLDRDGDLLPGNGDYLTMEHYAVLTRGHPDQVAMRVRPVGP